MVEYNFFCFKWGEKYDFRYVNRLYGSLLKNFHYSFAFHCITDNSTGLNSNINVIDIEKIREPFNVYPQGRIFTREKLSLFGKPFCDWSGKKAWFDLDILIQNDITDIIDKKSLKPRFIWNYWRNPNACKINYSNMTTPINSSFVCWQDTVGYNILEQLYHEKEKAFYTYPSLDKYLYYRFHRYNKLEYHPKGVVYNYNVGVEYPDNLTPEKYQFEYKICLFNTSHKAWAKPNETQIELHEADGWAKKLWESYDKY